jgi:hypothetical protein
MVSLVRRWLQGQVLVLVSDGGLTAVKLGLVCSQRAVTWVSRLRLDACLYDKPEKPVKGKRGPKPKKGKRLPSLQSRLDDPQTSWRKTEIDWYGGRKYIIEYTTGTALWYTPGFDPLPIRWVLVRDPAGKYKATAFLNTALKTNPLQILAWFILRWNVEVTFEEARSHLGVESQRQWSDLAIARTTPLLLGLFSLVTLWAYHLTRHSSFPVRSSAWYTKKEQTFSDALAVVRRHIWFGLWGKFVESTPDPDYVLSPASVFNGLVDSICYST